MSEDLQPTVVSDHLPTEIVDRLTKPLGRFLRIEAVGGGLLLLCTIIALTLSNSPWHGSYSSVWDLPLGFRFGSFEFVRSSRDWINDVLMTLFFFVVALELKRELVLGELRNPRSAAFSIVAALGGMVVPGFLYLLLRLGSEGAHGWGTVMATDTAFVIGCLALLGRRVPQDLRVFMLSLAIVDDIGAILVVAIGYSSDISWVALSLGVIGLACVRAMAVVGIRSIPIYFLAGTLIWFAVDASGLHATVAGVALGLLTPTGAWVSSHRLRAILDRVAIGPSGDHRFDVAEKHKAWRVTEIAFRETMSPVQRLEMMMHPWVSLAIMPLFALANAGVPLSSDDLDSPVTLAIFVGLVVGKPLGILVFSWLSVRSGLVSLPTDVNWGMLAGGGLLAGIGFTMALFIADLAFDDSLIHNAKLGILLASVVAAVAGLSVLVWSTKTRTHRS